MAIDGKTEQRTHDRAIDLSPLHIVSAWSTANRLVLGQVRVDTKSNEITAIPVLLRLLDLEDCIVTIDAMGCQVAIAEQIVAQGADYVLACKGNQGHLAEDVACLFRQVEEAELDPTRFDYCQTICEAHGRREVREYWSTDDLADPRSWARWSGLRSVAMVRSSAPAMGVPASRHASISRACRVVPSAWPMLFEITGALRSVHWVLDVVFAADESRVRIQAFSP